MANTEGMPDEVVEQLLLGGSSLAPTGGLPNKTRSASTTTAAARRRRAMEERMEMSMGDRPSARVIRSSPNNHNKQMSHPPDDDVDPEEEEPKSSAAPPIIMGEIVERSSRPPPQPQAAPSSNSTTNQNQRRPSRFSQQQRQQHQQGNHQQQQHQGGFPSVHIPLGTFVKPKKRGNSVNDNNNSNSNNNNFNRNTVKETTAAAAAAAAATRDRAVANSAPTHNNKNSNHTTHNSNPLASLQQVSAKDADAMLAQMTLAERREKAHEIQAALSPETIAFLKRRAQARQNNMKSSGTVLQPQSASINQKTRTATLDKSITNDVGTIGKASNENHSNNGNNKNNHNHNKNNNNNKNATKQSDGPAASFLAVTEPDPGSLEEKQRIAKLLSNIKSYNDLDAAYQAEMGNYSPLQSTEISAELVQQVINNNDDNSNNDNINNDTSSLFQLACTLLRSTVPRQNLWAARVVSKRLQEQWQTRDLCSLLRMDHTAEQTATCDQTPWPYPIMLPASLRCLLDSSVSHTNGYVLHTYVLQALYNLLRLRACGDHVVDVDIDVSVMDVESNSSQQQNSKNNNNSNNIHVDTYASAIFQEYFLEDAVPTPAAQNCYESIASVEVIEPAGATNAVAYKTSSSSTSAQNDGEAFAKDPMWTLLSRMCMIPRLAQLMRIAQQTSREGLIPKEAIVASCGILAMMSLRSPGAATAIVHHPSLLKHLLEISVMPREYHHHNDNNNNNNNNNSNRNSSCDNEGTLTDVDEFQQRPYDPVVAVPALRLLCAVARQSRTSASKIPFDNIVPPLLAMKPKTAQEYKLQKWSVILWRTLLRFGFGLEQIPIMITMSTPHIALGSPGVVPHSLTPEFSSSFANVLQCVQVARRFMATKTRDSAMKNDDISNDQYDALSRADLWLSSSARQIMANLEKNELELASSTNASSAELMAVRSGQLQFLSAFLRTSNEELRLSTEVIAGESHLAGLSSSDTWVKSCQKALAGFIDGGLLKMALDIVSPKAFVLSFKDLLGRGHADATEENLMNESSACAFLCSFVSLQHCILMEFLGPTNSSDQGKALDMETRDAMTDTLIRLAALVSESIPKNDEADALHKSGKVSSTARRGWLNRACFSILELLTSAYNLGLLDKEHELVTAGLLRKLQFALIGRLERGDEAMAVILFSQDSAFKANSHFGHPAPLYIQEESSVLSTMFFREMCRTTSARAQLDHSFKLRHGPGISPDELGAFNLSSLLSDAEAPGRPETDFVLPLGMLWLWQVLSSSISPPAKNALSTEASEKEKEVVEVLSSCLGLILELEQEKIREGDKGFEYAPRIPAGAKAYHLLNICLHPEGILQNELVTGLADLLMDLYNKSAEGTFGLEFARACVAHSGSGKKKAQKEIDGDKESAKAEKLVNVLLDRSDNDPWGCYDEKELRALVEFSGELCQAYTEYGAQYDYFTKCVRLFLLPIFPPRVRIEAMKRLCEILHRISLPGEDDPSSEECRERLIALLERSIVGGIPDDDDVMGTRDPPGFLDAIGTVYSKGGNPQLVFGYVFLLGILVHCRHLVICLQPGSTGLVAARKRLQSLNPEFSSLVIDATRSFLRFPTDTTRSKKDLVNATMKAVVGWYDSNDSPDGLQPGKDNNIVEAIDNLKATVGKAE